MDTKRLSKWVNERNLTKLHTTLKKGSFKERTLVAQYLAEIGDESSVKVLKEALNDSVPLVVKSVVKALKTFQIDEATSKMVEERLQSVVAHEQHLNKKIKEAKFQPTEAEKQASLERYAAETHLRAARREEIKGRRKDNRNNFFLSILDALFGP